MKYIHYIRLLKAGAIINDYAHTYALMRLAALPHVKTAWVLPARGKAYTEYRYEPPVADVQLETPSAPLALITPTFAHIRLADKVRYVDNKRVASEQWSGKAYPVTDTKDGFVLLDTGRGVIGRKVENVKYADVGTEIAAAA